MGLIVHIKLLKQNEDHSCVKIQTHLQTQIGTLYLLFWKKNIFLMYKFK